MWRLRQKKKTEDKFMCETCVICLDQKQLPHYLDCGHSFCTDCITTYIEECDNKLNAKCPLCRKKIYNGTANSLFNRPSSKYIILGFFLAAAFLYTYEKGKC